MSERDGMELDFSIGGDRFYVWIENVLKRLTRENNENDRSGFL